MAAILVFISLLFFSREVLSSKSLHITMTPDYVERDDYYCTSIALPEGEHYIYGFKPFLDANVVHHMILFGCPGYHEHRTSNSNWGCKEVSNVCGIGSEFNILYAWANQASGLQLPQGVGVKVGEEANVMRIVMQVHFHRQPSTKKEYPHLKMLLTKRRQPYIAGIYLLARQTFDGLPGDRKEVHMDVECTFNGPNTIYPFAFRTHAHSYGKFITGYVINSVTKEWTLIGQHDPQEPQAFYPSTSNISISPGDIVAARCYFDTSHHAQPIMFGSNSEDEMCNYYIMYYMDNNEQQLYEDECWQEPSKDLHFPDPSQFLRPIQSLNHVHITPTQSSSIILDELDKILTGGMASTKATPTYHKHLPKPHLATDWPLNTVHSSDSVKELLGVPLGQVTGVSVDRNDKVYVLHRGERIWDARSFSEDYHFRLRKEGPISAPVLIVMDSTGNVLRRWGKNIFYLPHGLSVDNKGLCWMTDVARQQLFKIHFTGKVKPLALGKLFEPGIGHYQFCQPADIAVDTKRNVFYVADGYCNHRIVVYNTLGIYLKEYSTTIDNLRLMVPHSLALSKNGDELYVADRENGRIIKYNTKTEHGSVFIQHGVLGEAVYALTFATLDGDWPMYVVNGSMDKEKKAVGFTLDKYGNILNTWSPYNKGFNKPHDIAVNKDGTAIYVAEISPNRVWKFNVGNNSSPSRHNFKPFSSSGSQSTIISSSVSCKDCSTTSSATSSTISQAPPTLSTSKNEEDLYTCPTPPPPPHSISFSVSNSIVHQSVASSPFYEVIPVSSSSTSVFNILPVVVFIVMLVSLFILLVPITAFVVFKYYKNHSRRISNSRPIFKVRRHYSRNPSKKLNALLKPTNKGFTQVRTYDSQSDDDEEVTVFQKT